MADLLTPTERSRLMSRIGSKNTEPELRVRRAAHALGYRFRLHRRDLPGTPDLVFPKLGVALFVHGCFWHRHPGCRKAYTPKSRIDFWASKFASNVERDAHQQTALLDAGWRPAVIWECETENGAGLEAIISLRVGGPEPREETHQPTSAIPPEPA